MPVASRRRSFVRNGSRWLGCPLGTVLGDASLSGQRALKPLNWTWVFNDLSHPVRKSCKICSLVAIATIDLTGK